MSTLKAIVADLNAKSSTIEPIGSRLKFVFDDELIVIDGTGDTNTISTEDVEADCTIRMSLETYGKLQRKEIKPFMATMSGKIKVEGDIAVAAKLKKLM